MSRQLAKILKPGERLVYRFRQEDITARPRLLRLKRFLLIPVYWLFFDIVFEWLRLDDRWDPWAFAVTDRRVLVRHGFFRRRYLDMRLSDIVDIRHDAPHRRLIFVATDAALQLECRDGSVRTVLNAIDTARKLAAGR